MFTLVEVNSVSLVHASQASLASAVQVPGVAGMPSQSGRGNAAATPLKDTVVSTGVSLSSWQRSHIRVCHSLRQCPGGLWSQAPMNGEQGNSQSRRACVLFDLRNLEITPGPGSAHAQGPCSVVERELAWQSRSSGLSLSSALAGYVTGQVSSPCWVWVFVSVQWGSGSPWWPHRADLC